MDREEIYKRDLEGWDKKIDRVIFGNRCRDMRWNKRRSDYGCEHCRIKCNYRPPSWVPKYTTEAVHALRAWEEVRQKVLGEQAIALELQIIHKDSVGVYFDKWIVTVYGHDCRGAKYEVASEISRTFPLAVAMASLWVRQWVETFSESEPTPADEAMV